MLAFLKKTRTLMSTSIIITVDTDKPLFFYKANGDRLRFDYAYIKKHLRGCSLWSTVGDYIIELSTLVGVHFGLVSHTNRGGSILSSTRGSGSRLKVARVKAASPCPYISLSLHWARYNGFPWEDLLIHKARNINLINKITMSKITISLDVLNALSPQKNVKRFS
jgi:hypothetical protein